ncbi:MAG: N-acetylmuramoyl-L-alanine amidase [Lachnospiraceae bacterium]
MGNKKLLLISGHGDGDSGAVATIKGKTYKEATETVVMVKKIKSALNDYNVDVDIYDTAKDAYKVLCQGGHIAFDKYDIVLEIHFNACVRDLKGNGQTTGTEMLLPSRNTQKDTTIEKDILKRVASLGFKNRGCKTQSLMVINTAASMGIHACLFEICFLDDADDMQIYTANKDKIAKKIANAFVKCWELKKMVTITEKAALRNDKIVIPNTRICWIPANTRVEVLEEEEDWIKVSYNKKNGYVVKSKTN